MRVCVTHYTIWSLFLTWWVLEGSMNGRVWEEIDRKSQCMAFKRGKASFQVENPRVFRFIRLTQADESDWGLNPLRLDGVEFFGTLVE
jgi:hypothetical protein